MAYVIIDSCIKDSLFVEVCPTDCVHPSRTNPVSKPPLRCMWIPRVVSTVAPVFRLAPPTRFMPSTMFRRTRKISLRKMLPFTSIDPKDDCPAPLLN